LEKSQQPVLIYCIDKLNTVFSVTDLIQLSARFQKVVLFHAVALDPALRLPPNVIVVENYMNWPAFSAMKVLARNITAITGIYLRESAALKKLLSPKKAMATLASNIYKADHITRKLGELKIDTNRAIFYSFWFYDNIFLAILKMRHNAARAVCRAHGGDLFEERSSLSGKPLFRNFQLSLIDQVHSVSQTGTAYLKNKYPAFSSRIKTSYLGTTFHNRMNQFAPDFVIVTCAKVRNVKRIHLLAEALLFFPGKVTWYHIGDENLGDKKDPTIPAYKANKEKLLSRADIIYKPLGKLDNEQVFDFYANTPVSVFVSVSATEGIPVSMMEAASFGIPLLSTDVGGCHEIVNGETGQLMAADPGAAEVAAYLEKFQTSEMNTPAFRARVRREWETKFDVQRNYSRFYEQLIQN
jgi:glycosyltransferase involved in cell wall biosynthesis